MVRAAAVVRAAAAAVGEAVVGGVSPDKEKAI